MKTLLIITFLTLISLSFAQKTYTYQTIPDDSLGIRIYKLDNGLSIYTFVKKDAPMISANIAVRVGSKNDPLNATGSAHMLEHMLFKGTSKIGTIAFEEEKPFLKQIDSLFEIYSTTIDSIKRVAIYHLIDSISVIAATYTIPNEYKSTMADIGATIYTAKTSFDKMWFEIEIPSNQLENWLTIESERFREPVFRQFATELGVIYEEKNRLLDREDFKEMDAIYEGLFPIPNFGTKTLLGKAEHLLYPSPKKLCEFYSTYFVPNNMAIIMCGDFDPEFAVSSIADKFSYMKTKKIPEYILPPLPSIDKPIVKEIYSPTQESVVIAFSFKINDFSDIPKYELLEKIMKNGQAGLIDLGLKNNANVSTADINFSYLKEYAVFMLKGEPKEGKSVDSVKQFLLSIIEAVKAGDYPDWMHEAVYYDMSLAYASDVADNSYHVTNMLSTFINGTPFNTFQDMANNIKRLKKKDMVDFANNNLNQNYVIVFKHKGNQKTLKMPKLKNTPLIFSTAEKSDFSKKINSNNVNEILPVDVNFFQTFQLDNGTKVIYSKNTSSKLFDLFYFFELSPDSLSKIYVGLQYIFKYGGTFDLDNLQLSKKKYRLGYTDYVGSIHGKMFYRMRGCSGNMLAGLHQTNTQLTASTFNEGDYKSFIERIPSNRNSILYNKHTIFEAIDQYALFGTASPFAANITSPAFKINVPEYYIDPAKRIFDNPYTIAYYGPLDKNELIKVLNSSPFYKKSTNPVKTEIPKIVEDSFTENEILIVNRKQDQVEILTYFKLDKYDTDLMLISDLYTDYMYAIMFQELRTARGLVYTLNAMAVFFESNYCLETVFSFPTQPSKVKDALSYLMEIIQVFPESSSIFETSKKAKLQQIASDRPHFNENLIVNYTKNYYFNDIATKRYNLAKNLTLADLKTFHQKYIQKGNYKMFIIADKDKLDLKELEKYGKIHFISLEEIFGYE